MSTRGRLPPVGNVSEEIDVSVAKQLADAFSRTFIGTFAKQFPIFKDLHSRMQTLNTSEKAIASFMSKYAEDNKNFRQAFENINPEEASKLENEHLDVLKNIDANIEKFTVAFLDANQQKSFTTESSSFAPDMVTGTDKKGGLGFGSLLGLSALGAISVPLAMVAGAAKALPAFAGFGVAAAKGITAVAAVLGGLFLAFSGGVALLGSGAVNITDALERLPSALQGFDDVNNEAIENTSEAIGHFFNTLAAEQTVGGITAAIATSLVNARNIERLILVLKNIGDLEFDVDKIDEAAVGIQRITGSFSLIGSIATNFVNNDNIITLSEHIETIGSKNYDVDNISDYANSIRAIGNAFQAFGMGSWFASFLEDDALTSIAAQIGTIARMDTITDDQMENLVRYTKGMADVGEATQKITPGMFDGLGQLFAAISDDIYDDGLTAMTRQAQEFSRLNTMIGEMDIDQEKMLEYVTFLGAFSTMLTLSKLVDFVGKTADLGSALVSLGGHVKTMADFDFESFGAKFRNIDQQEMLSYTKFLGDFAASMAWASSANFLGQLADTTSQVLKAGETLGGFVRSYNEITYAEFSKIQSLDPDKIRAVSSAMLSFSASGLGRQVMNNLTQLASAFGGLFEFFMGDRQHEREIARMERIGRIIHEMSDFDGSGFEDAVARIIDNSFDEDRIERLTQTANLFSRILTSIRGVDSMADRSVRDLEDSQIRHSGEIFFEPLIDALNEFRTDMLEKTTQRMSSANFTQVVQTLDNSRRTSVGGTTQLMPRNPYPSGFGIMGPTVFGQ